ncbi:hypothetical protein [Rhodococcoides fascians]|uniref:hypothetical protein n=1 Tax=Rhodococcoides fascians TaxID=1828 RepID=UPI000A74EAD0|nr:hypothetical protein [Rhodococcus fascians]
MNPETAVLLAQVLLQPTESTSPPPTGPVTTLPTVRGLMLVISIACVAAVAFSMGRMAWTWKHKDGRGAENTKMLIGAAVCFLTSFAAYELMGWIA